MSSAERETRSERRPSGLDLSLLVLALALHAGLCALATGDVLLDVDVASLVYGMREFNLPHFNPHPPGYLLYVLALRALHALRFAGPSSLERLHTAQLLAAGFGLATVVTTFAAARRIAHQRGAAGWAALIVALNPLLLFHSVDAQTHTSEAFAAASLILAVLAYERVPGAARAALIGGVLALGAAFRPSFVLFGVPFALLAIGLARWRHLMVTGAVSLVGAVSWFLPTIVLAGGYSLWSSATRALVHDLFVRTSSPLSESALPELMRANLYALGVAILQAFAPVTIALLVQRRDRPPPRVLEGSKRLLAAMGASCLTPAAYYALTFFSEPGYLLTALPVAAILFAWFMRDGRPIAPLAAVMLTVASGLIPARAEVFKTASLDSWQIRSIMGEVQVRLLDQRLPSSGDVLVIWDVPDATVGREIPMLRPNTGVLLVYGENYAWVASTYLVLVTADDCEPLPSKHVMATEGERRLVSKVSYEWLYIDDKVSPRTQAIIAAQSRCPYTPVQAAGDFRLLPTSCLRDRTLTVDGLSLVFPADARSAARVQPPERRSDQKKTGD